MNRPRRRTAIISTAVVVAAYRWLYWPLQLRWGATAAEAARPLPGDALVSRPHFVAHRAITIQAPPEAVWPWLVQMGSGRAGWYAWDRLDNAAKASATTVLEEFQHLAVGDLVPMVAGSEIGLRVKDLEPGRRMLWWDGVGEYTWEWLLEPVEPGASRLHSRLRVVAHPWTRRVLYEALAANGDIVMHLRMLRGVKKRAERLAQTGEASTPALERSVAPS